MPLTLRVNIGDCVKVNLKNKMKEGKASFSAIGLAFDPKDSLGANVGNNTGDQTIAPGAERTYTYYADPFNRRNHVVGVGLGQCDDESTQRACLEPWWSARKDPSIVIRRPGADLSNKNAWAADVIIDRSVPGNEMRVQLSRRGVVFPR